MTREEQLQAAAQIDVVAHNREMYEYNINYLVEKLRKELEGALEYENFLRHNPYYTDKTVCRGNHEDLNDIYKAVVDLPMVYITHGDELPTVNLAEEGY